MFSYKGCWGLSVCQKGRELLKTGLEKLEFIAQNWTHCHPEQNQDSVSKEEGRKRFMN